jgi:hypothetical protein
MTNQSVTSGVIPDDLEIVQSVQVTFKRIDILKGLSDEIETIGYKLKLSLFLGF